MQSHPKNRTRKMGRRNKTQPSRNKSKNIAKMQMSRRRELRNQIINAELNKKPRYGRNYDCKWTFKTTGAQKGINIKNREIVKKGATKTKKQNKNKISPALRITRALHSATPINATNIPKAHETNEQNMRRAPRKQTILNMGENRRIRTYTMKSNTTQ